MRRIVHHELGEPARVLRVEDGPSTPLGPDQVRVRVSYAPIHPGDLLGIMGSPAFGTPPTISPGGRVPGIRRRWRHKRGRRPGRPRPRTETGPPGGVFPGARLVARRSRPPGRLRGAVARLDSGRNRRADANQHGHGSHSDPHGAQFGSPGRAHRRRRAADGRGIRCRAASRQASDRPGREGHQAGSKRSGRGETHQASARVADLRDGHCRLEGPRQGRRRGCEDPRRDRQRRRAPPGRRRGSVWRKGPGPSSISARSAARRATSACFRRVPSRSRACRSGSGRGSRRSNAKPILRSLSGSRSSPYLCSRLPSGTRHRGSPTPSRMLVEPGRIGVVLLDFSSDQEAAS